MLSVQLFGGFHARLDPGPVLSLPSRKAQALLAYLALRPGQAHPRNKLAALLWGESTDARARDALRHAVGTLRHALPGSTPPILLTSDHTLALNPTAVTVDVAEFERCLGEDTPEALEQASALYAGDLLSGVALDEPLFEDWLLAERERLRELALEGLAKLLAHQRQARTAERAIRTAIRLLALDPLQEAVHRTLMRLYVQLDRRGAALHQYQLCVGALHRELGVEPEEETRQLYQQIVRSRRRADHGSHEAPDAGSSPPAVLRMPAPSADMRLVGREQEMARLGASLADARRGEGQVVVVRGEAGVGKSRLVAELAGDAMKDCRVLLGRSHEAEQILPLGPWVDALRAGRIVDAAPTLERLPPRWRNELRRLLPELPTDGTEPELTAPDLRKLFEALTELMRQLAQEQVVVLILEDVHWADEMTLRLLAFMSHRLHDWPILLITTVREEELADAPLLRRILEEVDREPHVARLRLAPLSHGATTHLVRLLAGSGQHVTDLGQLGEDIWRASEGNPFVVVETMRALEQGAMPQGVAALLPERVRDVIAGRLDRLEDVSQQLVAVAAVIGREFEFALLQRAAGLDEREAAGRVETLVRRHLLQAAGDLFDFAHDRIRAVAYDQMVSAKRRLYHRRVGEALEGLYAGRLEPYYLALGSHFRDGEIWDKAVKFFRLAGVRALAHSASREAEACFAQALEAMPRLTDGLDTTCLAIDVRLDAQGAYVLLGDHERMLAMLGEAESLARAIVDTRRLAHVWAHMTAYSAWTGRLEDMVDYSRRALVIGQDLGDRDLEVLASSRLAGAHLYLGQYREANEVAQRHIEALGRDPTLDPIRAVTLHAVSVRLYLAVGSASLGDFATAAAVSREASDIATRARHPYSQALADFGEGRWRVVRGAVHEAVAWLDRSLDASRRGGFYLLSTVAAFTGVAYARLGWLAEGVALLEESAEPESSIGFTGHRSANLAMLAEAYLLSGRPDDALRTARAALDLSRARKERGYEAEALWVLGEICTRQEPPDVEAADRFYRGSLGLAEELGMGPLIARCHLGLGVLYRRAGRPEPTRQNAATAFALFRQMGMRPWPQHAELETEPLEE